MKNTQPSSRLELPIPTHWNKAQQDFSFMAADAPDIGGTAKAPFAPGECYYEYNHNYLPDFNCYLADRYAQTAISDEQAQDFVSSASKDTGLIVDLLQPDAFISKQSGLGRLVDKSGTVQIVHAKVIDGSLATIILPPNWSSDAPESTYPIVFNGFYDINANVFTQEGPFWVRMIAESGKEERSGAIGVLWNGGGATASRTTNEAAYRQFNSVINYVSQNFSGDRHRILISGGSRGGLTAVNMASNPYGYDYTVIFAAATATPTLLGEHASLTSTTYPPLLPSTAWSVGLSDSWKTGWVYPECAGRPHLTGLTGLETHLFILTGTSKIDEGNILHSPMSERFIQGLLQAGTRIFLTVTEKDNIVPYNTQLKYAMRLLELGVPCQVEVLLRGGHTERLVNPSDGTIFVRREKLQTYLLAILDDNSEPVFSSQLTYYAVNRTTGILESVMPADAFIPFSVDFPYVTARGMRFPVVFVGQPGTEYALLFESSPGQHAFSFSDIIPDEMTSTHWFEVPPDFPTGEYIAVLRIKKPRQNWKKFTSTLTPSGDSAIMKVESEEPNIGPWEAWEWCKAPKLVASTVARDHTNWGLTEY